MSPPLTPFCRKVVNTVNMERVFAGRCWKLKYTYPHRITIRLKGTTLIQRITYTIWWTTGLRITPAARAATWTTYVQVVLLPNVEDGAEICHVDGHIVIQGWQNIFRCQFGSIVLLFLKCGLRGLQDIKQKFKNYIG